VEKQCLKCKEIKDAGMFHKRSLSADKLHYYCKECRKEHDRSFDGLLSRIYSKQKTKSTEREHPAPSYTIEELGHMLKNSSEFAMIFNEWHRIGIETGVYISGLKPSIDRIDSSKPYTMDNIQVMPWGENNKKGHSEKNVLVLNITRKPQL